MQPSLLTRMKERILSTLRMRLMRVCSALCDMLQAGRQIGEAGSAGSSAFKKQAKPCRRFSVDT